MTNYGALAILAQLPENWLRPEARLLIALETVTVSDNGERLIGMRLLAEKARLPYGTARDARDRLVAAGLVSCRSGSGRGYLTGWRVLFPLDKGADSPAPSAGKGAGRPTIKVLGDAGKGAGQNPLTCGNENTGLKAGLKAGSAGARANPAGSRAPRCAMCRTRDHEHCTGCDCDHAQANGHQPAPGFDFFARLAEDTT